MTTDTTKTYTGVVKWFGGNGKHFGFISPDDDSKDVFVHISALGPIRELNEGDRVKYSVKIDERSGKACAADLKLI